jgi:tetratricopeptide (TPR) repeat protein
MKKSVFYLAAIFLFIVVAGFMVIQYKKDAGSGVTSFYPLKERPGRIQAEEAKQVQEQFANLMKVAKTNPDDTKSRIALAALYIQEARITGDYAYYNAAAMKYVDQVLEKDPAHFEALTFKALLFLSRHRFAESLDVAEKARQLNPDNAFVHGILVDGHVEMGNYDAALVAADRMISIRPDIRSYSRVSYLREIHGDYPGAIEAMKLAMDAGRPGDEATEWARVQLADLYMKTGNMKSAEMHYLIALEKRPGYAHAIAGKGQIALAAKNYNAAIDFFLQADSLVNDHAVKEQLADAYLQSGQKNKSDSVLQWLIHDMSNATSGHHDHHADQNEDLELAHLNIKAGNYDEALHHALAEYNRRPKNIEVNEAVAWAYYMKKEYHKALPYIENAMRTNSKNPELLAHAALVFTKTDHIARAKAIIGELYRSGAPVNETLRTETADVKKAF